jgi:hypothetical protein
VRVLDGRNSRTDFIGDKEAIMSDMVVHGVPGSPFMRAVRMGLEEKRTPYRVNAMRPGDSKSEKS